MPVTETSNLVIGIVIKKGSKIYKETNKFIMHLFDVLFSENA